MRERKVGTLTCGIVLIVFGVLCFIQVFTNFLSFGIILKLWPCILILLGVEMLYHNYQKKEGKFVYDFGAIALIVVMSFFAMAMGAIEFAIRMGGNFYL